MSFYKYFFPAIKSKNKELSKQSIMKLILFHSHKKITIGLAFLLYLFCPNIKAQTNIPTVSANPGTINQTYIATNNTFKITAIYTNYMNTAVMPTITFTPNVTIDPNKVLTFTSGAWKDDELTYEAIYTINKTIQYSQDNILVTVSGGAALVGSVGAGSSKFNIQLNNVKGTISYNNGHGGQNVVPGVTFYTIEVDYGTEMNATKEPAVALSPIPASLGTPTKGWRTGNKIYYITYPVTATATNSTTVGVTFTGGESLTGQLADPVTGSFLVDFLPPSCSVEVTPSTILSNTTSLTVKITYNETMADAPAPTIAFPTEATTKNVFTQASGSWDSEHKIYTAIYNVSNQQVSETGNVVVSNAKDVAGNVQTSGNMSITIDQGSPRVTNLAANPISLNKSSPTLVLTITFSSKMNTLIPPTISFNPALPVGVLSNPSFAWTADGLTVTATYQFDQNTTTDISNIGVEIKDAQNVNGNVIDPYSKANVFSISMNSPICTGVTYSTNMITEATTSFEVTITYDRDMDKTKFPTVTWVNSLDIQNTLTVQNTTWTDSKTCKVIYKVTDKDLQETGINSIIAGAVGASGNAQASYNSTTNLTVDMLEIIPTLKLTSGLMVDCHSTKFSIPIEFNQKMDAITTDIITFLNPTPDDGFLVFINTEWDTDQKIMTVNYSVHGNVAASSTNIDIQMGEIKNSYGKALSGKLFADAFSVKSNPPTVTVSDLQSPTCHDKADGSITVTASDGTPNYTYQWYKDGDAISGNTTQMIELVAGDYTIKVTGSDACYTEAEAPLINPEAFDFAATVVHNVERRNDGEIKLHASGGTEPYAYYFDGVAQGDRTVYDNLAPAVYTFKVEDTNLCSVTTTAEVKNYSTPTAFTPNGDGYNDEFMPGNRVRIFDRNGTLIFEGPDGWDGKYKGQYVQPAVYFYIVTFADGTEKKGTVQVFIP